MKQKKKEKKKSQNSISKMCRFCVRAPFPERNACLEAGAYLLNFKGCAKCGTRSVELDVSSRKEEEEEEEIEKENVYTQSISFAHTCKHCGHVIAEHRYEFLPDTSGRNIHGVPALWIAPG